MNKFAPYPKNKFELTPLGETDEGGWLIAFPDLPGCLSDGESLEEAVKNGAEAEKAWLAAADKWGRPKPKSLVARLPVSLHREPSDLAKAEGVSLNTGNLRASYKNKDSECYDPDFRVGGNGPKNRRVFRSLFT